MNYEDLRELVSDGDVIAVRSRRSLLGRITTLATRSPYTHTGIAVWLEGGVWMSEMDGSKNVLVPLSQYVAVEFDVFPCPVDGQAVRQYVLEELRARMGYDWMDVLRIGAHVVFGVPLPPDNSGRICSSHTAQALMSRGWLAPGLPSIPWPGAVVTALGVPPKVSHSPG